MSIDVRFWGTRGTFPAVGPAFARHGGDTACVALACGARTIVFDAGTGLARLGKAIGGATEVDLLLSHAHLDHVLGLAYFDPIWRDGTKINVWLEESVAADTRAALHRLFAPPFHPVALSDVPAKIEWPTFRAGAAFAPFAGARVIAQALPHPGGAHGFRVEHEGATVVYGADTGALTGALRTQALTWARDADLLILDATFTCAEGEEHPDWGHMTWREACAFGIETGAKRVALYHHGPDRTDEELDQIAAEARALSERILVVRDGLSLNVPALARAEN